MRIAVDAMGGDKAPGAVVEGAVLAASEFGLEVVLVGQKDRVERELARYPSNASIEVAPASQLVGMSESPSTTLKKRDSSMMVAFNLAHQGRVQAVVSAGNSGAVMATGMFVLGNLPLVGRPAILAVMPTLGKGTVIIDAGANVDCKPRHLLQFGVMGSVYAEQVLGITNPRVGVLSNGEEEEKGNDLTRAASEQLRGAPLNYIGYVEGRDLASGGVDVVVCDGFTGNVVLKTIEGVAPFVIGVLKKAFQGNFLSQLGLLLCRRSLSEAYSKLDYAEYGGAPLLGLGGVAIIAHGGSSPKAIKNAVRVAKESVTHDVNRHIVGVLQRLGGGQAGKSAIPVQQKLESESHTPGESIAAGESGKDTKGDQES
jgi:glycerol-3-phosphate acyltransferase PlsX